LERTHNLFVAILERLQKDIQLLANESSQWQKDPTKLIKRLDKSLHSAKSWRRKGQIKRRSAYEEAKVYANRGFENKSSIFVTVPVEPLARLKEFMTSYCAYFESEGKYEHAVQGAVNATESSTALAVSRVARSGKVDAAAGHLLSDSVHQLAATIELGTDALKSRWATLANDYHQTIHALRENGCPF
jgi:hypothetical protein